MDHLVKEVDFNTIRSEYARSWIPNWLMRRPELSSGAKLCYARLRQYAGQNGKCMPRQSLLAVELGVSERSIRDYVSELKKEGLIEVQKKKLGGPNHYRFFDRLDWIGEETPCKKKEQAALASASSLGLDQSSATSPLKLSEEQTASIAAYSDSHIPSVGEVIAYGEGAPGIPEDYCRHYFNTKSESFTWTNNAGRVKDWRREMTRWWAGDREKWLSGKDRRRPQASQQSREELEYELEQIKAEFQWQEDRGRWAVLNLRRREIEKLLGLWAQKPAWV